MHSDLTEVSHCLWVCVLMCPWASWPLSLFLSPHVPEHPLDQPALELTHVKTVLLRLRRLHCLVGFYFHLESLSHHIYQTCHIDALQIMEDVRSGSSPGPVSLLLGLIRGFSAI